MEQDAENEVMVDEKEEKKFQSVSVLISGRKFELRQIDNKFKRIKKMDPNNCLKTLKKESDLQFQERFKNKMGKINAELQNSINLVIEKEKNILITAHLNKDTKLENALIQEALSVVLYNRFESAFYRKHEALKNILEKEVDSFHHYFYDILNQSKETMVKNFEKSDFKKSLERQVGEKLLELSSAVLSTTLSSAI